MFIYLYERTYAVMLRLFRARAQIRPDRIYYTTLYSPCRLTAYLQTPIRFVIEQCRRNRRRLLHACKSSPRPALTSSAVTAIVGSNQDQIAKVMELYAIAMHDVCVEDHD